MNDKMIFLNEWLKKQLDFTMNVFFFFFTKWLNKWSNDFMGFLVIFLWLIYHLLKLIFVKINFVCTLMK